MRNSILAGMACAALIHAPALAVEPRKIATTQSLKQGMGAVRISIQSQVQLTHGTLFVWFLREGSDPSRYANQLRFERETGVPVMGSNMVDSKPLVFALQPGRYRFVAHGTGCSTLPPPNAICTNGGPTERYEDETPVFEVKEGHLTDAGEFILEAPVGTDIGEGTGVREAQKNPYTFRIRLRPSAQPLPKAFASMPAGPAIEVPDRFRSSIQCRVRPKGAMMYLPFEC